MVANKENESCKHKNCLKKILVVIVALILLRALWLFGLTPIGYEIETPAATATSACPTMDTLTGSSHYETAPVKSSASAIRSANSLLQDRADTEAGLAFNGYTCPNPACQQKSQGPVTATPAAGNPTSSATTFWAMAATVFDLFGTTYYSGLMDYSWSTTVTCR